jgi:hypothetical protein
MEKTSSLGSYLKELRHSFTPTVYLEGVATGTGVSESFLCNVENGNRCLTPEMAQKIAVYFYKNRLGQQKVFLDLLKRIVIYQYPQAEILLNGGEPPNIYFIKRLNQDIKTANICVEELTERVGMAPETLELIRAGEGIIPREQIFMLALALGQRPTEYLLLSGYLPYETMNVLMESDVLLKGLAIATEMQGETDGK